MARRGAGAGEHTLQQFLTTTASLADDDYRRMANGGTLNREDLAKTCGFASRSTLTANADVKLALAVLEEKLRAKGILAQRVAKNGDGTGSDVSGGNPRPQYDVGHEKRMVSAQLLDKLQKQVAEKDARIKALEEELRQFTAMKQALRETGRMPR